MSAKKRNPFWSHYGQIPLMIMPGMALFASLAALVNYLDHVALPNVAHELQPTINKFESNLRDFETNMDIWGQAFATTIQNQCQRISEIVVPKYLDNPKTPIQIGFVTLKNSWESTVNFATLVFELLRTSLNLLSQQIKVFFAKPAPSKSKPKASIPKKGEDGIELQTLSAEKSTDQVKPSSRRLSIFAQPAGGSLIDLTHCAIATCGRAP